MLLLLDIMKRQKHSINCPEFSDHQYNNLWFVSQDRKKEFTTKVSWLVFIVTQLVIFLKSVILNDGVVL